MEENMSASSQSTPQPSSGVSEHPENGIAVAALVMGILSLVLGWIPFLGFIFVILAIVFGFIGLKKAKQNNGFRKGMAIAGLAMGFVGLVFTLVVLVIAYFGVLSPASFIPERTTFMSPIANIDNAVIDAGENSFAIAFTNRGSTFTLPLTGETDVIGCDAVSITGTLNGNPITPETSIAAGDRFILTWDCPGSAKVGDDGRATLSLDYIDAETGQQRQHTGTVVGIYK